VSRLRSSEWRTILNQRGIEKLRNKWGRTLDVMLHSLGTPDRQRDYLMRRAQHDKFLQQMLKGR
jgi:hypothetical protein